MANPEYRWRGAASDYRVGNARACPGCGHANWLVGRSTAECAYCATALPLAVPVANIIRLRAA